MASVTAYEAKLHFGKLLARVARGEELIITKHEKPVARLIPEGQGDLKPVREAVTKLRALQKRIKARGEPKITFAEFKSAREEGRR